MDNKSKKRLIKLFLIGITLGFLSEIVLTILYSWQVDFIQSSYIYFALSIILMVSIGLLIIFLFLKMILTYQLGSNIHYLLYFMAYDIFIVIGGLIGKLLLTQLINHLQ